MNFSFLILRSPEVCSLGTNIFSRLLKKRAAKKPGPGLDRQDPLKGKAVSSEDLKTRKISRNLKENKEYLVGILGRNVDLVTREINPGGVNRTIWLVYLETLADNNGISESILKPLMLEQFIGEIERPDADFIELIENSIITAPQIRSKVYTMDDVTDAVMSGTVALFVDGCTEALLISLKDWPQRGVEKADIEVVVRGPKESFAETIDVNAALVRRRLRSPNLVIEGLKLGRETNTDVAIAYLKGVVSPGLVQEVKSRVDRIDIDGILESGYIEELIQDDPYSPFPQLGYSERPDRVVSTLLQGRVCILIDGTPMVLYVPVAFTDMLQSPEDYYERYHYSTAIRLLRFLGLIISLLLPSFYIAITTYHQEMIPTQLLISIVAYREGVPLPAVLEALVMEMTFEALREAGIRLPRAVGQAVSIVGALVIGQAAVQAGVVSPLMVIVVALTGIASFMIPAYNQALSMRLIRFPLMLLAATLGLFGVMTGLLAMLIHMASLRSFGMPYLAPLAPLKVSDLKDTFVRVPWWAMHKRPTELVKRNKQRMAPSLKPRPPGEGGSQSSVNPVKRNAGIPSSYRDYGGSGKDQGTGAGNSPSKRSGGGGT